MSKKYNEKQILNNIHNAASKVEIPDSVKPENMMQYIASKKEESYFEGVDAEQENIKKKMRKRVIRRWTVAISSVAAVLTVVIGVGFYFSNGMVDSLRTLNNKVKTENSQGVYVLSSYKDLATYVVAEDSKYDILTLGESVSNFFGSLGDMFAIGGAMKGESFENNINWAPQEDLNTGNAGSDDYYDTNSRTEGVGEADIVKTDGEYIYYTYGVGYDRNKEFVIVKADGEKTSLVCCENIFDDIEKMIPSGMECNIKDISDLVVLEDKVAVMATFSYNDTSATAVLVYDVSDKVKPVNVSALYIEGEYSSCKYVDGYMYIFTEYTNSKVTDNIAYTEEKAKELFAPIVSGDYMNYEDIYVAQAEEYRYYNVIASLDIKNPSKFVNVKAVLGDYGNVNVYVSNENIYIISNLYNEYVTYLGTDEKAGELVAAEKAEIVRLSYKEGVLTATGRTEIAGGLGDEFDIDEYNGYLRMAVTKEEFIVNYGVEKYGFYSENGWTKATDWCVESRHMSERSSVMYILDGDLKLVGEVTLQDDEKVYGVRFDGDIAYVVTYRQTDPLFTVDLSDPTRPNVMGELKIPGFSEYLHIWDENTLVGLGETDDGCLKISTYDITDKYNVTEDYVKRIKGAFYSNALYDHREVFISPEMNIIGFSYENGYYSDDLGDAASPYQYSIYEYRDGKFIEIICESLYNNGYFFKSRARGLYIGEYIYIVDTYIGVYVYSMEDYSKLMQLDIN